MPWEAVEMTQSLSARRQTRVGTGASSAQPETLWSGPRRPARDVDVCVPGSLSLDTPEAVRLHLQRRAPANLRLHVRLSLLRLSVLIAADLLMFLGIRALVRFSRDDALFGVAFAVRVGTAVPRGILSGWDFLVAMFVGLVVFGNYGQGDRRHDVRRLFAACALATALPLWNSLWERGVGGVLLQYVGTLLVLWVGLLVERFTINRVVGVVRTPDRDAADTLFVGPGADCVSAAAGPAFTAGTDFRPIGFVDSQFPPAHGALGHVDDITRVLAASGAQAVVLCGFLSDKHFEKVVDAALAGRCHVLAVPRAAEVAGVHPTTVWRRGQALIQLTPPNLNGPQLIAKRLLDLVGGVVGFACFSPVLGVLALLIKLESRGPVFFTQERVGRGGKTFRIFKLRTMVADAEARRDALQSKSVYQDYRLFKIHADPRITRMGRWLRKTSLDEVPQLINVILGDMSLVGPRPPLPSEVALYEGHHYARFDVKPGITGPWQAGGRNNITDFDRVIALEAEYIRNWSLALDVSILLRTVPAVCLMRGAH